MYTTEQLISKVNHAIEHLALPSQPAQLYEPIRYTLAMGGKRIRPVLMLMAYNLYKEDVDSIMQQAVALETYHNFTLLHDDLMDHAEMRRGIPCVHLKWDENTAILSGDAMLILAYQLFTQPGTPQEAIDTFNQATLGVCDGQQFDMDFEKRNDVQAEEYIDMIRLKTSLLLSCALKIGAQLAGANAEEAESLRLFGEKLGLAFQLQDDLLDVYGNPAVFGKKIGGDIVENKKTYMLISALQLANAGQRKRLEKCLSQKKFDAEEKIFVVTSIYNELHIRELCEEKINQYFDKAKQILNDLPLDEDRKAPLRDFAHRLLKRKN